MRINCSENRPFSRLERVIAWRYLTSKRSGTALSVIAVFSFLGVCLGVATLVIVMAVMNGFREDITSRLLGISGHIFVESKQSQLIDKYTTKAKAITDLPGVQSAIPYVYGTVLAQSGQISTGGILKGISAEDIRKIEALSNALPKSDDTRFADGDVALIGSSLAMGLGITVGDNISILTAPEGFWKDVFTPSIKSFTVAAILSSGNNDEAANSLYVDISSAQKLRGSGRNADFIEVYLEDQKETDSIKPLLQDAIGNDMTIIDWKERNKILFSALSIERNVMFIILSLIIVVAALNIISGMIMLVKSKTQNIAILKTMGLSRSAVLRVFMMTGSLIGIVGTLIGAAIGVAVCLNIQFIGAFISYLLQTSGSAAESNFFAGLAARMDPVETALIIVFSLLVSLLAPIFPAARAASLDPVKGIRS